MAIPRNMKLGASTTASTAPGVLGDAPPLQSRRRPERVYMSLVNLSAICFWTNIPCGCHVQPWANMLRGNM